MASVKVKFRPSTIEGKEGTVYYQIIQNRLIRQLKTDYRIFTDEWNEAGSCIIVGSSERSNLLLSLQECMEWDLKRLDMIIRQLDNRKSTYTANDIIVAFQNIFLFYARHHQTIRIIEQNTNIRNLYCGIEQFHEVPLWTRYSSL